MSTCKPVGRRAPLPPWRGVSHPVRGGPRGEKDDLKRGEEKGVDHGVDLRLASSKSERGERLRGVHTRLEVPRGERMTAPMPRKLALSLIAADAVCVEVQLRAEGRLLRNEAHPLLADMCPPASRTLSTLSREISTSVRRPPDAFRFTSSAASSWSCSRTFRFAAASSRTYSERFLSLRC